MARPNYLRPRGSSPLLQRPPIDPGFTTPEIFQPDESLDPGFLRRPTPGPEARHPGLLPVRDFGADQEPAQVAKPPAAAPGAPLKDRLLNAVEGAAGQLDPNSESGAESFLGTAINVFHGGRQMSRQQAAQADKIQQQKLVDEERRARTRYYDAQAQRQPTGQTQADRLELEDRRHEHLTERLRTAADLRRRQIATANDGKVSPADRVVLGRTERADQSAARAVETQEGAVSRGYADRLTPAGTDSLRARVRRAADPNYAADSTAVADRINPALGVPRPAAPAAAPAEGGTGLPGGVMDLLRNYMRKQGGTGVPRGGQSVVPSSSGQPVQSPVPAPGVDEEGDTADTFAADTGDDGFDEGDDAITGDELTAALDMVSDLDEEEARNELVAAGYSDAQVDKILKSRPTP
jgi:hypothetical protein